MLSIKGKDYLNAIWEMAAIKGCKCETDKDFAQDSLGAVKCDTCNTVVISQEEVDQMESDGVTPLPHITNKKLNNWFENESKEEY